MADIYQFAKSEAIQSIDLDTPFADSQWNYINDINSGVYSGAGISLVQFDLSSIYNSATLVDMSEAYITVPIVYQLAYVSSTTTGALVAPTTAQAWSSLGLKNGYFHLAHACDLQVNGKTVESYQPFLNQAVNFKLLSTMTQDNLAALGFSLGMGRALDNPESVRFNNNFSNVTTGSVYPSVVAGAPTGNGLCNNFAFGQANPDAGDQTSSGIQGVGTYNQSFYARVNRCVDTTTQSSASSQNLYNVPSVGGSGIMSITNLQTEMKPTFAIVGTNYSTWNDVAVIRLKDIMDSMSNWPLTKKFDGMLRLYINTGSIGVSCVASTSPAQFVTSGSTSTFTNCCPLLINQQTPPATSVGIACGLFIARSTQTSIFGVNFASSGASTPMTSCRLYFPQVTLKAEKMVRYISENRAKKVCWKSFITNQFNNLSAGASFSGLVQSGVSNIEGVLVIPYISSTTNGLMTGGSFPITGITPFSQYLSPFDTAPATTAPLSLINFQVTVGGKNVLQNTTSFCFENFLEQISQFDKIGGSDIGLSCGLFSQYWWETNRYYYADCSRGQIADLMTPRNVNVSFTNNTQQAIDVIIITFYQDSCVIDVESGLVKK